MGLEAREREASLTREPLMWVWEMGENIHTELKAYYVNVLGNVQSCISYNVILLLACT